jgi:hypothetical protein
MVLAGGGRCCPSVDPRQGDDESGAVAVGGRDRDRPSVAGDDVVDDGQTEAGAAGLAGAGVVQPREALKDRRVVPDGMPGPSSPTTSTLCSAFSRNSSVTVVVACRSALLVRFPMARRSCLGSPRTRAAEMALVSTRTRPR